MSLLNDIPLTALQFYLTAPYPCSYLPGRAARSQVATPSFLITPPTYAELVRHGFRRSGNFIYRPRCDGCQRCIAVRLPVQDFRPTRAQRRCWRQHNDLSAQLRPLHEEPDHFPLYQRYLQLRHADGSMDQDNHEQFRNFLMQSQVDTLLVEFRAGSLLRMVSIIDLLDDGLSAVYTFYDPGVPRASFGTYGLLWQIELCRKLELPYLYPGYWIAECRKMAYKTSFRPMQGLIDGRWQPLPDSGVSA